MTGELYAGRGVANLGGRSKGRSKPVDLDPDGQPTYLPDPLAKVKFVWTAFMNARGFDATQTYPKPHMTLADVYQTGNHFTLALRHDLPTIEPHDAAAIWDEWRNAIALLREDVRTNNDPVGSLFYLIDRSARSLALALREPMAAYRAYCPWRQNWATYDRLFPGRIERV